MKNTPKQYILHGIKHAPENCIYRAKVVYNTYNYSHTEWISFNKHDIVMLQHQVCIHGVCYEFNGIITLEVKDPRYLAIKTLWSDEDDEFYQKLVQKGGTKGRP